ncbi:MAG: hypothetical protein ACFFG0_55700, partial [Candidatus Thorarchaeota archaeon]
LEYIKKKGRTGTVICVLLGIGFLSKGLLVFIEWCFGSLPAPIFFSLEPFRDFYVEATSIEVILTFSPLDSFIYFLICLISLVSLLSIAFGIYLAFFNKKILRTKFRSYRILFMGIINAIVFGIPTSIRLMI